MLAIFTIMLLISWFIKLTLLVYKLTIAAHWTWIAWFWASIALVRSKSSYADDDEEEGEDIV